MSLLLTAAFGHAAEIRGKVTNVVGGEPLARVEVSVLDTTYQAVTSRDGTFRIKELKTGNYTLRFDAVGYRLVTVPFALKDSTEIKEFEVNLAPDNFRRTDKVEVRGDVFQGGDPAPVTQMNLTSSEIKEASTVLADDPFRAVQALPGVSASGNNELFAEFSVAGAPYSNVGIYLDDVLIPSPTHTVPNQGLGASLSLISSETVEEMKLVMAAYPEKFGDDTGAALDIHTREGSRTKPLFRLAPGLADSEFLGEGGLGHEGKGSWLASFRKSYIGWLVRNRVGPNFSDISFYDADVKLSYDVAPGQNLSLYTLGGHTNVKTTNFAANGFTGGAGDFYFSRIGWRSTITENMVLSTRAAYIRQPLVEHYLYSTGPQSASQDYQEWTGGSNLVWNWAKQHVFEGGWTLRRMSYPYQSAGMLPNSNNVISAEVNPITLHGAGFVQQASTLFGDRLHLLGGIRYDQSERYPNHPVSPQLSMALKLAKATSIQFGYGHYVQNEFPPNIGPPGTCTNGNQGWGAANHYTASAEQRVSENTRIRFEAFTRQETDIVHFDPIVSGCPVFPNQLSAGTLTSGHTRSRGVQFVLQRRSANRLSGWIGYTLVSAQRNSTILYSLTNNNFFSPYYSAFEDQRHSLNSFATYRLKPTVNLSGKLLFGSGFPFSSGYVLAGGGGVLLLPVQRLPPYLRIDLRADKSWAWTRWKLTLYGEVLNLTNHENQIVTSFAFSPTGQLQTTTAVALPVTPTAGLAFEF